jgi:hypothetical protein
MDDFSIASGVVEPEIPKASWETVEAEMCKLLWSILDYLCFGNTPTSSRS